MMIEERTCPKCNHRVWLDGKINERTCPQCGIGLVRGKRHKRSQAIIHGIAVTAGVILGVWILVTAIMWLMPLDGEPTLREVLQSQWKWVSGLTRRLW